MVLSFYSINEFGHTRLTSLSSFETTVSELFRFPSYMHRLGIASFIESIINAIVDSERHVAH